jgi:hypothetical protein
VSNTRDTAVKAQDPLAQPGAEDLVLCISRHLSDVQAFVLGPLAAVAVGVFKSEVVVLSELFREDVVCESSC